MAAHDVFSRPSYTVADVGRYLSLPDVTVRAWVAGTTTGKAPDKRRFPRVIVPAATDGNTPLLSFQNLLEVHTLSLLRRKHNINLKLIRQCIDKLKKEFGVARPLIYKGLYVDPNARKLLVDVAGRIVGMDGQQLAPFAKSYLERVDVGSGNVPIRLFPFDVIPATSEQAMAAKRHVVIDPERALGRACVVGTRVPIEEIAGRFKAGDSVEEIATDFERTRDEIEAAIRLARAA